MDNEMRSQIDWNTWEIVKTPPGVNIVSIKWTYHCKTDSKGLVTRPKSHIVAQGFTQTFGVDYDKTYAPVIQMASFRTICAIAACNEWPIHQMDVDVAYINAKLENPVYMQKPPGYCQNDKDEVLLLKKCIYSLKRMGREWYKCLTNVLKKIGFTKTSTDAAVFYRHGEKGFSIIGAAVDDLMITAKNDEVLQGIKKDLSDIFKMKDLGEIHWLLNLKIE